MNLFTASGAYPVSATTRRLTPDFDLVAVFLAELPWRHDDGIQDLEHDYSGRMATSRARRLNRPFVHTCVATVMQNSASPQKSRAAESYFSTHTLESHDDKQIVVMRN